MTRFLFLVGGWAAWPLPLPLVVDDMLGILSLGWGNQDAVIVVGREEEASLRSCRYQVSWKEDISHPNVGGPLSEI